MFAFAAVDDAWMAAVKLAVFLRAEPALVDALAAIRDAQAAPLARALDARACAAVAACGASGAGQVAKLCNNMMLAATMTVTSEAFVMAEKGRSADPALEGTLPLVLYFGTKEDREEFVAVVREAKPGMYSKHLP